LGGDETLRANVRVVAATNQNLEPAILEKRFREDLYYRIKVITITLPPLRMRREDLPNLIAYFMAKHGRSLGREGVALAPETSQLLQGYDWPGNVRELENSIKRALLLCKGRVIRPELMAADMRTPAPRPRPESSDLSVHLPADFDTLHGRLHEVVMGELEHKLLVSVLRKVGGNQVRAAALLGISRVMLHDRIKRYGIRTETVVHDDKPPG
jgi:DNA-binding NtrC family response regulator